MSKEYDIVPSNLENNVKKKVNVTISNSTGINVLKNVEVKTIHNESSFTLISIKNQIYPVFKRNNQEIFQEKRTFSSKEAGMGALAVFGFVLSVVLNVIQITSEIEVEINPVNISMMAIIGALCFGIFILMQQINTTELAIKKELDHYLPYNTILSSNQFVRDRGETKETGIKHYKALIGVVLGALLGVGLGFSNFVADNTYETVSLVDNILIYGLSSLGLLFLLSVLLSKSIKEDVIRENFVTDVSLVADIKDLKNVTEQDKILDIGIAIQVPLKRSQSEYEEAKEKLEKKYKDKVVVGLNPYSNYKNILDSISINNLDYTRLIAHIYKEKINEKKVEDKKILHDKNLEAVMKQNIEKLIIYEAYLHSKKNSEEEQLKVVKDFKEADVEKMEKLKSERVIDIIFELLNVNKSFGKSLSFLNSNHEILKSRNEQLLLDNTKLTTLQSLISSNDRANRVQNGDYGKKGLSAKTWFIIIFIAIILVAGYYYYENYYLVLDNDVVPDVEPDE